MVTILRFFKDYLEVFCDAGIAAWALAAVLAALVISVIAVCLTGYGARLLAGAKRVRKFFDRYGWVDNSNINLFIGKAIRKFPYNVRAGFSLYMCSDKHLTAFLGEKAGSERDYSVREKLVRDVYKLTAFSGGISCFLYLSFAEDIITAFYVVGILLMGAVIAYYFLSLLLLWLENRSKRAYLRALDIMANGIFINADKAPGLPDEADFGPDAGGVQESLMVEKAEINEEKGNFKPEIADIPINQTH